LDMMEALYKNATATSPSAFRPLMQFRRSGREQLKSAALS